MRVRCLVDDDPVAIFLVGGENFQRGMFVRISCFVRVRIKKFVVVLFRAPRRSAGLLMVMDGVVSDSTGFST